MGSRGSKSRSSKSSRSGNVSSRSSIKNKSIEEKIKVVQLIAESNFNEQKLKIKHEAKRLEIEKVAKTQTRAKVLNLLDIPPLEGKEDVKERNMVYRNHMRDAMLHWTRSMRTGKNLNRVRNPITLIPYLEMQTQIILLLIIIASLENSQECCDSYLSKREHRKLMLMFFQGILSYITVSWKYSRK